MKLRRAGLSVAAVSPGPPGTGTVHGRCSEPVHSLILKEQGAQLRIVAVGCLGSLDPLIQSFSRHLLSTACMLDIVLGNTAGHKKHRVPAPGRTDIPAKELDST